MGRDRKRIFRTWIAGLAALAIAFCGMPAGACAAQTAAVPTTTAAQTAASDGSTAYVKEGSYQFTETMHPTVQVQDTFVYRDDYFVASSFKESPQLAELSIQASLASASYYAKEDRYAKDPSANDRNIIAFLNEMGFEDVEANAYYSTEPMENSIGVAVGHREFSVSGKPYTLLAVFPRGSFYKEEWVGDFLIGSGNMHEGFHETRDEILRYVKQYVQAHRITGDVKLWTAGHSRGAANATMTAAFFADGGADYLGSGIRIEPEDIYCYSFATPIPVRRGLSRAEELSVSGARGGAYAADTPEEPYVSTETGTVDPGADCFKGIRNYLGNMDLVAKLPLKQWGYAHYGSVCAIDAEGKVTSEQMLQQLQEQCPLVYIDYMEAGLPEDFQPMTIDIKNLRFQEVPGDEASRGVKGQEAFLEERGEALFHALNDAGKYEESGVQDAFKSFGGIYGMMLSTMGFSGELSSDLATPMVLAYLAYASEELQAEGLAKDESEAVAYALADLTGFVTGASLDPSSVTVDECVIAWGRFIAENEDTPAVRMLRTVLNEAIPEDMTGALNDGFASFVPGHTSGQVHPAGDILIEVLKACAVGPDKNSKAAKTYRNAARVRVAVYILFSYAVQDDIPKMIRIIGHDGDGSLAALVGAVQPLLMGEYDSIGQMADEELTEALEPSLMNTAEKAKKIYGQAYYEEAMIHVNTLLANITPLRKVLSYLLFYTEGEGYSAQSSARTAATWINCSSWLMLQHFPEVYLSWMRCARIQSEVKPANTMVVKVKTPSAKISLKKIKKAKRTVSKAISVTKAQGAVTYTKVKVSKQSGKFTVNGKTGAITIKKGTKKGTYKVTVRVAADGGATHQAASTDVTIKIVIK